MHCPADQPRASISYGYQVHDAWLLGPIPPRETPMLIAGAGPAGLTTALELARHGVPCVLLETE